MSDELCITCLFYIFNSLAGIHLHFLSTCFVDQGVSGLKVDYELISIVYSAFDDTERVKTLFAKETLRGFALYLLIIYFVAGLMGSLVRTLIMRTNLDRVGFFEKLRFTSDFAYVALGRGLTTSRSDETTSIKVSDVDQVEVEIVVTLGTELVYYTGILIRVDYFPDGEPSRLYLSGVSRGKLEDIESLNKQVASTSLAADYVVLKVSDIHTVNFSYYSASR